MLNQRKLDRGFAYGDEFFELVIRVARAVSETASEVKQEAFARMLVNSSQASDSAFNDKLLLARILEQISESEILVLTHLERLNRRQGNTFTTMAQSEIADVLHWPSDDVQVALDGLRQLGLVQPRIDNSPGTDRYSHYWDLQDVAYRLIQACQSSQPQDVSEFTSI